MNFWNLAVLGLTFLAPVAAILFIALKGDRAQEMEIRTCLSLFAIAMVSAALGVAHFDHPVMMELLWPLTMEQSGYFEFSFQMLWSRFVWIFFSASMLLGFAAYDASTAVSGQNRRIGLLFLIGSFFSSVLAFLSENTLLSLMFVEFAAFMLHAFGMETSGEQGDQEKASYFKRSCFIFLSLAGLFAIVLTRELSTSSVMLVGAVLYIFSTVVSKNNPKQWNQLPLLLVHIGMGLFLLERVLVDEASPALSIPFSAIFAVGAMLFSAFSLLSPASLGASFWLILSFLTYLLYLRFSSGHPGDPFWGSYEVIGLGAAYALATIFRFGEQFNLLWKRAFAFVLLAIFLGVISGALPSVEISAVRFDGETTLLRAALLGFLTFLISTVSAKALAVSLSQKQRGSSESSLSNSPLASLAPAILMLAAHVGLLIRWNELNFDSFSSGGLIAMFYDTRVLITTTAVGGGLLAGGLLGSNSGFANWTKSRSLEMENFFPGVDPGILRWNLRALALPERGLEWLSLRISSIGSITANWLDSLDRGFFGDKFFRRLSEYTTSLSLATRFFHSGYARAYLFLGVVVALVSSLVFLMEGSR